MYEEEELVFTYEQKLVSLNCWVLDSWWSYIGVKGGRSKSTSIKTNAQTKMISIHLPTFQQIIQLVLHAFIAHLYSV